MKLTNISDFKIGGLVQGFYICKEKHLRNTRNNDLYLDLVLADASGTIKGKMWDMINNFQNRFRIGDPVAVKGKVSEFNDKLQLTITLINRATSSQYGQYGYSPEKLVKKVDEPIIDLWNRLSKTVKTIKSPLKELVTTILKKNKQKIMIIPASVNHNLPLAGGFLKHLVDVSDTIMEILPHYSELDRDLTLAGVILHDIGKLKSINDGIVPNHTNAGKLFGHMILGRDIIIEVAKSINNFPNDLLAKLEHIILTQRGTPYNNTVTLPKFPEALCVHYVCELDRKLNLMLDIIKNDPNQDWTSFHSKFRTELLKK